MNPWWQEFRAMVRLAAPLAAGHAGLQLMSVVDTAVLGRLGATALGAAGLGSACFFAVWVFGMGVVMGIDPLVSQAVGAGDEIRARRILWQGVWLALIAGCVLSILTAFTPLLLRRIIADREVVRLASVYLLIRLVGFIPMLLYTVVRSYLQARAVTRPIVISIVITNIFNLLADLLLVFGGQSLPSWTGPLRLVPALGVAGAAWATVIGNFLQLIILAWAVRMIRLPVAVSRIWRPIREDLRQGFQVGLPVGLQFGAEVGIFVLVGVLAGRLGRLDLAAHQVAITLASFTFTVAVGVSAAASVRVGRAIGARDQEGTRRAGVVAFATGAGVMLLGALGFWMFPRQLAALMSNKPDVLAASIPLIFVAAVFQISDGTQSVGAGVLRGAADTRYAFIANVIGHWLIGLPVALLLGFYLNQGIVGMWWGLCAGLTAVAALLLVRFLRLSSRPIAPLASATA
jgi:MATE family multidrug resistance protein